MKKVQKKKKNQQHNQNYAQQNKNRYVYISLYVHFSCRK